MRGPCPLRYKRADFERGLQLGHILEGIRGTRRKVEGE